MNFYFLQLVNHPKDLQIYYHLQQVYHPKHWRLELMLIYYHLQVYHPMHQKVIIEQASLQLLLLAQLFFALLIPTSFFQSKYPNILIIYCFFILGFFTQVSQLFCYEIFLFLTTPIVIFPLPFKLIFEFKLLLAIFLSQFSFSLLSLLNIPYL